MSEMKEMFTQGPWLVWQSEDCCRLCICGDEKRGYLTICTMHGSADTVAKDNAALIAAAPEMYEALGDAQETMLMIEQTGGGICAQCPWGRKCKTCAMTEVFRLAHGCEKRLESIQKKARGEE